MGDFIGECVACGSSVEQEHDEGDGYFHTIEENYMTFGRFANKNERDLFCNSAWDRNHEVDPEPPFFYTIRAYPASQSGTAMILPGAPSRHPNNDGKHWFKQDSAGIWNFPIHDCCLEILDQYIAWNMQMRLPSSQLSSRELFYNEICRQQAQNKLSGQNGIQNCEIQHPGVAWGHGYFGAQQGWSSWRTQDNRRDNIHHLGPAIGGDPLQIRELDSWICLYLGLTPPLTRSCGTSSHTLPSVLMSRYDHSSIADPTADIGDEHIQGSSVVARIPECRSTQLASWVSPRDVVSATTASPATVPVAMHFPQKQASNTNISKVSALMTLPTELFEQVLQDLPPRSIVSLHRSCKAAAARLYLDNRFWRKSLLSNTLLGFTWDLDGIMAHDKTLCKRNSDEALTWDWKKLACTLAKNGLYGVDKANSLATPAGLKARRRIWRCIEEIGK